MNQILESLDNSITQMSFQDFAINLGIVAILCLILRVFYIKFGTSISNRKRFAANFLPIGFTTMLIIKIVSISPILSLGLVGALSIIRFRAAIKDPEELSYLFIVIGISLALGANLRLIALLTFFSLLIIIALVQYYTKSKTYGAKENLLLAVQTPHQRLDDIIVILNKHLDFIELRKYEKMDDKLLANFVIQLTDSNKIDLISEELNQLSKGSKISMVVQPGIAL